MIRAKVEPRSRSTPTPIIARPNSRWIQPHDVKLNVSRPFSATTK